MTTIKTIERAILIMSNQLICFRQLTSYPREKLKELISDIRSHKELLFRLNNTRVIPPTIEYILCSSIYYNDNKKHLCQPINIKTGFCLHGLRHTLYITLPIILDEASEELQQKFRQLEDVQGFLTNRNRFVTREEGYEIALKSKQLQKEKYVKKLYSEDLW